MTVHDPDHDFHQFRHFDRPVNLSPSVATALRKNLDAAARQARQGNKATHNARPFRKESWEEQMSNARTAIPLGPGSISHPSVREGNRQRIPQVQAMASFGLVLAVLLSLVAISFHRMSDGSGGPAGDPAGHAAFVNQEGTPSSSANCVARAETWDAALPDLDPDRPARYTSTRQASTEIGNLALETYLDYMTCAVLKQTAYSDQEEIARINDTLRTYQTANGCSAEVEDMRTACVLSPAQSLGAEFLFTAPITLNRPPQLQLVEGTRHSVLAFSPSDVYVFFDGRYGVIMGSPSTAMFRDGFTATDNLLGDSVLIFVAFREHDGLLYIDELTYVFIAEGQPEDAVSPPAATPATD